MFRHHKASYYYIFCFLFVFDCDDVEGFVKVFFHIRRKEIKEMSDVIVVCDEKWKIANRKCRRQPIFLSLDFHLTNLINCVLIEAAL